MSLVATVVCILIALLLAISRRRSHCGAREQTPQKRSAPYSGIYIKGEDVISYGRLELTCSLQMKGRLGTKRLILVDKKMTPLMLWIRMSPNRDWYRLNITPKMRHQAKDIDDDSDIDHDTQVRHKMTRCRQADMIDEIIRLAADKEAQSYSLVTQQAISSISETIGEGVRVKRRRLMAILEEADRI